jgi:hypothetical protein
MVRKLVGRLAETSYVRRALTEEIDLARLRRKPTPRMIAGLILIGVSYLIGWPAVAAFGFLAVYLEEPMIVIIGGPATYAFSYVVFFAGAWLAGAEYAKTLTRYGIRKIFQKLLR